MKKIGMVLGSFCPLHQGHLDLIMMAKKQNDLCYVIVCGYDNDKGGDLLPLSKRYRYVKEEFKNDELIKVICVNDTKLGIDQSMSLANWHTWLNCAVFPQMDRGDKAFNESNLTWYVGEKSYEETLTKDFGMKCIYVKRNDNPISGTMIRNNPIKYWDKITPTFRKVFSHNILITGTASEGKTTLTKDIARYFGLPYSEEMGRIRMQQTNKYDDELDFSDFHFNIYEQNKINAYNIDSLANRGVIISDTDNLVTLMYARKYAEEDKFLLSENDYQTLFQIVEKESKNIRWSKIFVLAPHNNFVDDGVRWMGHKDKKIRDNLFEHLICLLKYFKYEYEILDGNYYENYLRVKEYIEGVLYEQISKMV